VAGVVATGAETMRDPAVGAPGMPAAFLTLRILFSTPNQNGAPKLTATTVIKTPSNFHTHSNPSGNRWTFARS
jgi:hypothetical protein